VLVRPDPQTEVIQSDLVSPHNPQVAKVEQRWFEMCVHASKV
jgi:hypothetical protein